MSSRRSAAAAAATRRRAAATAASAGEDEPPPSPLEDDLGVEDFDLKHDHLLGPSPVPPPLPDDLDHNDDDDDDDEGGGGGSSGSFRMKKGSSSAINAENDHDHIVMLDEERDAGEEEGYDDDDDEDDGDGQHHSHDATVTAIHSPDLSPRQPSTGSSLSLTSTPSPKRKKRDKTSLRKHPSAPKRFKSSYICFFTAKQPEIKERLGRTATVGQISRESAQMWKNLTADEKAHWDDVAAKDKERYMAEKEAYTGPWQAPFKRQKKDKGSPKRPMSAFLHFSQIRRQSIKDDNPNIKNTEISCALGEIWRRLTDDEKLPFIEQEKAEREKYKKAMAAWKSDADKRKQQEQAQKKEEMKQRQEELKKQGERILAYQRSYNHARPAGSHHYNPYTHHQHHPMVTTKGAPTITSSSRSGSKTRSGLTADHGREIGPAEPGGPTPAEEWQHIPMDDSGRRGYGGPPFPWGGPGYAPYFYPGFAPPMMYPYPSFPPSYPAATQGYAYGATSAQQQVRPHPAPPVANVGSTSTSQGSSAFTQTQPRQHHQISSIHHTEIGRSEMSDDLSKAFAVYSPKPPGRTGPTSAESTTPIPLLNDLSVPSMMPSPEL